MSEFLSVGKNYWFEIKNYILIINDSINTVDIFEYALM